MGASLSASARRPKGRRIRGLVVAALLTGAGALVVPAFAATGRAARAAPTTTFDATVLQAPVETANGWPDVGGTEVVAAVETSRVTVGSKTHVEHAAYRHDLKMTGHPDATTFTFNGTGQTYGETGSTKTRFDGTVTIQPDGSAVVTGKGTIVGGTGDRKGSTGKLTYTGTAPNPTGVYTVHLKGSRHT